jgi:hypothetical protein
MNSTVRRGRFETAASISIVLVALRRFLGRRQSAGHHSHRPIDRFAISRLTRPELCSPRDIAVVTAMPTPDLPSVALLGLAMFVWKCWYGRQNGIGFISLAIVIVCLGSPGPASATPFVPRVFGLEEEFFQAAAIVTTETFDEFATGIVLGTGAVAVGGITYSSDDPTSLWVAGILIHQVPPRFISAPNDFGQTKIANLTLTPAEPIEAIGFYLLTAGVFQTYQITVTAVGGGQFNETLLGEPNPLFRGYVAPEGISSLTISHLFLPQSGVNFSFDNVSQGVVSAPIPEPQSGRLLAAVLLGTIFWRLRSRRGRLVPRVQRD